MSDDLNKLIQRLRATFFEVRDFSLHDVRDAANALERVTEERDRLKAEVERLRGEQRLKSLIGPSENAVERIIAERDRLKDEVERLRNEKVAGGPRPEAMGGTPPATDPAPAVCEWADHGPEWISTCKHRFGAFASTKGRFFCPGCGGAIKFTEAAHDKANGVPDEIY